MGNFVRRTVADHARIGRALELPVQVRNLNLQNLKEVSHESFVFTFATFTFWGNSRTKASFSHLRLSDFEGCLARKLRVHIFHFRWGKSRTKASFSHFGIWGKSRIVIAASRLLGAAAACVILLSFAAGHPKSYWSACTKAAIVICQQSFSVFKAYKSLLCVKSSLCKCFSV